ncbi:MAG: hypothetical protein IT160_19935 [Bryobacterales bacterium]|nr:hypothetical protein [Bryobacterales bacterium]
MTRRDFGFGIAAAAVLPTAVSAAAVSIGSRRELFVDHELIASMTGAGLRPGTFVDAGPVLRLDRPWEGSFSGYTTLIHEPGRYRMYYRGLPSSGKDGGPAEVTCYAESTDGRSWSRPNLGLYPAGGSTGTNIILAGDAPFSHNFCPFLDTRPGVSPAERYKAVAGLYRTGLYAFVSADGIHWTRRKDQPALASGKGFAFDSQNLAFWSEHEKRYVLYYRTMKKVGKTNFRWVSRAISDDFRNWTREGEMSYGDAPAEHLYTNQTSPYFRAPHIYAAICARFEPGRQVLSEEQARELRVDPGYFKDCSDAVLVTSRGGVRYTRTFLEAFLRPGLGLENWVSRSNYPALNTVQTGPETMSFYVNRNYGQPTAYVCRYELRLDGFASAHAGYSGGELTTKPVIFDGSRLELNYSTSAAGGIRVELQDEGGRAYEGFSLADAPERIGDEIARDYVWKGGGDVSPLKGKPTRLRFVMKDADLYAFRFRNSA